MKTISQVYARMATLAVTEESIKPVVVQVIAQRSRKVMKEYLIANIDNQDAKIILECIEPDAE